MAEKEGPMKAVYLPIEVTDRELASKTALALELTREGCAVAIGRDEEINELALKSIPGLFLRKSVGNATERAFNDELRSLGHLVHAQDEESGVAFLRYRDFYKRRASLSSICSVDHFYCWTEEEFGELTSLHPECHHKMSLTGGLRTVLWGQTGKLFYADQIRRFKEIYGRFALFNTNFGYFNSARGLRAERKFRYSLGETEKVLDAAFQAEQETAELFIETIFLFIQQTDLTVLVRPHPGEDPATWEKIFRNEKRVNVARSGPVSPMILASQVVIQNRCTTGLEALAGQMPTIDLEPHQPNVFQLRYNGIRAHSSEEALRTVLHLLTADQAALHEHFPEHILGAGTLAPLTGLAEQINLALASKTGMAEGTEFQALARKRIKAESLIKRFSPTTRYTSRKSPNIDPSHLTELAKNFSRLPGRQGSSVKVSRVGPNSYVLRNGDSAF